MRRYGVGGPGQLVGHHLHQLGHFVPCVAQLVLFRPRTESARALGVEVVLVTPGWTQVHVAQPRAAARAARPELANAPVVFAALGPAACCAQRAALRDLARNRLLLVFLGLRGLSCFGP